MRKRTAERDVDFLGGPADPDDVKDPEPAPAPKARAVERDPELGIDLPSMGGGYERIIKRTFDIDEWAEFELIETALQVGNPERADYGILVTALDSAEDTARRAHRLYCNAVVAHELYDADARLIEAGMRDQAVAELEREKLEGTRSKAPTIADIEGRMSTMFTDEVRALVEGRAKAKQTVSHLERIADLWRSKCRSLQVMVEKSRH